jgi:hypothetical protein
MAAALGVHMGAFAAGAAQASQDQDVGVGQDKMTVKSSRALSGGLSSALDQGPQSSRISGAERKAIRALQLQLAKKDYEAAKAALEVAQSKAKYKKRTTS